MKNYVLTENQVKRVIIEKGDSNITKGFALKISKKGSEPYYESKMESFSSEDEVNDYINNLKEDTEVLAVIDIPKEKINESLDSASAKDKGLEILTRHAKKKYPFIKKIVRSPYPMMHAVYVNIEFDLMKFYELTGTHPGEDYIKHDYLAELLMEEGSYLARYVAKEFEGDFGFEYNHELEDYLTKYYQRLPYYLTHKQYEELTDEGMDEIILKYPTQRKEWLIKWKEEELPAAIKVDKFIPIGTVEEVINMTI